MCGIGAIVRMRPAPGGSRERFIRMHGELTHRGPDGEGILVVDEGLVARRYARSADVSDEMISAARLALAFRRLRIIDLDERADPPLARGRKWIVLNGEIYNYRELRELLTTEGWVFQTSSDTEVALAAYERWGSGAFEKMRGMWAILIADLDRGVLVGSRDRLGIKPMFYAVDGGEIVFASEPKIVARAMKGGPRLQPYRFAEFLRGLPPQSAAHSFFDGVEPVPAGTSFEIDLRDPAPPRFMKFWDLPALAAEGQERGPARAAELRELLTEVVREHTHADVPVGLLLSGGLDSSVIARLMAADQNGSGPVRTFTLTHADARLDEAQYAAAVVKLGGLEAAYDRFAPAAGWARVDDVVRAQGEPLLGFDLLGHFRMFELARGWGIPVVLDGLGADEIFGGYPFYEALHLVDRLKRLRWTGALADARAAARRSGRSLPRLLAGHVRAIARNRLARPAYPWQIAREESSPEVARYDVQITSALNRLLLEQTLETNLQSTMLHQDRNSMAHGIESRVPYLDHRVVELAFSLPLAWKIHRGERKRALLEVGRGLLPREVTERKDKRAIISSMNWIDLREHGDELEAMSRGRALGECGMVDSSEVRRFIAAYLARRHEDTAAVWRLYTASRWLEAFQPAMPA
jgi:asparagine synthase (glutamine-hydrolysing)